MIPEKYLVSYLVEQNIIEKPLDGNHGELHPKSRDFLKTGIPFIMASDLKDGNVDLKNCNKISYKLATSLRKGFSCEGDVLLSHKATIGRTAIVPKIKSPYIILTPQVTYYRVKNHSRLNNRYLKYYFDSIIFQTELLKRTGGGSTRAYIGITDQLMLPIYIPDIKTQNAIVAVLEPFDEKIRNLQQMDQTLESMVRTIFISWFINFDPVRKKAAGEPTGLPLDIDALFPDSFEDSEVGGIPIGWTTRTIEDCSRLVTRGLTPTYIEDGGVKIINQKCVREHKIDFSKTRFHDSNKKLLNEKSLFPFDILVNSTGQGTLGRVAQIFSIDERLTVDSHITIVRPKNELYNHFLGQNLINRESEIEGLAEGSTGQTELNRSRLGRLLIVVPNEGILKTFNRMIDPFQRKRDQLQKEILSLSKIRDNLLPVLISGELEIPDINAILEKTT